MLQQTTRERSTISTVSDTPALASNTLSALTEVELSQSVLTTTINYHKFTIKIIPAIQVKYEAV